MIIALLGGSLMSNANPAAAADDPSMTQKCHEHRPFNTGFVIRAVRLDDYTIYCQVKYSAYDCYEYKIRKLPSGGLSDPYDVTRIWCPS